MKNRTVMGALAVLALSQMGNAQETVNGGMVVWGPLRSNGAQAVVDFTAAGSTAPVKSGTLAARPGTCTVGQMYFATDAAAGQNLAYCTSAGVWTTVTSSGGGAAPTAGVNAQTGTSYTFLDGDCWKLVTLSNASPVGVTLPQAGSSWFTAGWVVDVQNRGAGDVTITPTTSSIDGSTSLVLTQNQGARIFSDGTNYFTERGVGGSAQAANPYTNTSGMNSVALYSNWESAITGTVSYTHYTGIASTSGPGARLFTLPAYFSPRSCRITVGTAFSGTNISGVTASLDGNSSVGGFGAPYPVSATGFREWPCQGVTLATTDNGTTDVYVTMTVTNGSPGPLTGLTQGSFSLRISGVVLQ